MLSPSDFNSAVPQFTNGNYASNPLNPQYIAEPSSTDYNRGVEPIQTLPAQWWNWFVNKFTGRFNKVNVYVKNIFNELSQLLSLVSETPSGTEATPTTGQLKDMFETKYPDYLKTAPALSDTYVPQTTMINGHALSADVTVTKSDIGLGSVVNTGDSETPTSGGTEKFTTGGAYTELAKKAPTNHASSSTTYGVASTSNYGHVKTSVPFVAKQQNVFGSNFPISITAFGIIAIVNTATSGSTSVKLTNNTGVDIIAVRFMPITSTGVSPMSILVNKTQTFSVSAMNGAVLFIAPKVDTGFALAQTS